MVAITWDDLEKRTFENGVDHGVLYIPNETGAYLNGVAWNGLTAITEKPTGAEATPTYADNIKYLNLVSVETFEATLEALTYPNEFNQFDGFAEPVPGIVVGQQDRGTFGLSYRTKVGNGLKAEAGYKLHLLYGALAKPSERAYNTVNESPEAMPLSWDLTTTPVAVPGLKPSALLTIDSTTVLPADLAALEAILYGGTSAPKLPTPAEVFDLFLA
jgi:hypothetical protein